MVLILVQETVSDGLEFMDFTFNKFSITPSQLDRKMVICPTIDSRATEFLNGVDSVLIYISSYCRISH